MRRAYYLIYPVIIACALLAGFFIYEQRSQLAVSTHEVEPMPVFETLESFAYDSMSLGNKDAPITVIEVMDYECPICLSMYDTIESLREKRSDIRFIFLPVPVTGSESSIIKSTTAWTMAKLGLFQDTHKTLMTSTIPYTQEDRLALMDKYSITPEVYEANFNADHAHRQISLAHKVEEIFGTVATPSFLINGKVYVPDDELPSLEDFENIINSHTSGDQP